MDVNIAGSVGERPLHLAAIRGHYKIVQMLLKKGARGLYSGNDISLKFYLNPLAHELQIVLHIPVIKFCPHWCCSCFFIVRQQDEEGNTPLHCCVRIGHFGILNLLLQPQYRNDAHIANIYLDTPLHT